ncbi:MAG: hypothetical protein Q4E57_10725 [Eubacteriales bacterium]|nr:hypothetical protein [Eubacteriales bacterium]
MGQEVISKEKIDFTIDLLITMVVEELSETTKESRQTLLNDFLKSKTGRLLYDKSSKLWWNGPSYIADMYLEEKGYEKHPDFQN